MAIATECQTPDAHFQIGIFPRRVHVDIYLPMDLDLTPKQAEILEANVHNAMELVFGLYFKKEKE